MAADLSLMEEEEFREKALNPSITGVFCGIEEIEAPMWADLTLEAKSMNQDKLNFCDTYCLVLMLQCSDDLWFQVAHPFHQCSSRQLTSAFSLSGEGSANSNSELLGPSSPKLPPSVSKSRGKHYRSLKWGRGNHAFSLNKQHPIRILGGKTSLVDSGSSQELKPKTSIGNSKSTASSKAKLVCESSSTGTIRQNPPKTISSFGDSKNTLALKAIYVTESSNSTGVVGPNPPNITSSFGDSKSSCNSKASIEAESCQQQPQNFSDVSHRTFGTSGLVSAMRLSLRTSFVMRQPSRVEIKDGKQLKGRKSSSSKSSVGSSMNPGYDVKNTTLTATLTNDRTPESRNVVRLDQAGKHKENAENVSKKSTVHAQDMTSKSRRGGKDALATKSAYQEASKSKVLHQTVGRKALALRTINVQDPLNVAVKTGRVGASRSNIVACTGKVNAIGSMVPAQRTCGKENAVRATVRRWKATTHDVQSKDVTTRLSGPKVLM
ncbi:hypothetical protein HHK36_005432 [Tetracentron sinense]|uniref:Uncharacterized protein n=1 Tax=Tetracentron sinense TaxID=13715 RepID=A0A834ZVE3_TETSI|nr:hypothetical protein HHK36_005432 [Tetracentron sinense]